MIYFDDILNSKVHTRATLVSSGSSSTTDYAIIYMAYTESVCTNFSTIFLFFFFFKYLSKLCENID